MRRQNATVTVTQGVSFLFFKERGTTFDSRRPALYRLRATKGKGRGGVKSSRDEAVE